MVAFNANYNYNLSPEVNVYRFSEEFVETFEPISTLSVYYQAMMNWRRILLDANSYDLKWFNHFLELPYAHRDDIGYLMALGFLPIFNSHESVPTLVLGTGEQPVKIIGIQGTTDAEAERVWQAYQDTGTLDKHYRYVTWRPRTNRVETNSAYTDLFHEHELLGQFYVIIRPNPEV